MSSAAEPVTASPRRRSLLFWLIAITIISGAAAGVIGAVVQASSARSALRNEIIGRNAQQAVELASRLDSRIDAEAELLRLVASGRSIAGFETDADVELRAALGVIASFDELVLYDAQGEPFAAAANRFVASPSDERARPDLVTLVADGVAASTVPGFPPVLQVAVGVESPPGTTAGALVARLPLEVVARPALRFDSFGGLRSFIIDDNGRVIVHPDRDRVLRSEQLDMAAVIDADLSADSMEIDGVDHLVARAPMTALPASVVISQDESVALASVDDQLRDLTLILALVIATTVTAISLAGIWLLAPLNPLAHAVRSLGRNELSVRVDEHSRGEVGVLAREFNRLAEVLDRRRTELDELQRLSLLVNTQNSRDSVADEVVDGAARLLDVELAAFCTFNEGSLPEVLALKGAVSESAVYQQAATSARIGRSHRADDGTVHFATVPIRTVAGDVTGALVVGRADLPIADDELTMLDAYAAFAGVALENVVRLELEQQLAAELSDAVENRRRLIGSVSHELRTPLACIDGFSRMLIDRWEAFSDPERLDLLERIRHHSRELDELVSRLLDFVVAERGTLEAALTSVDLPSAVREVAETMQPLLDGRPVVLDIPDIAVMADPVMLRRAVTNLLSNAAKYSSAGSPIEVRAVQAGHRVRLEVIDEGVGLSADESVRAFEPFWRSTNDSARSTRGAGLGLALVAQYARAMGGDVGVVSEPGHGSTFFITLRSG